MRAYFNRTALEAIHKACLDLGARKNHDYGACGDAIEMAGVQGVVTRMLDKQLRLLSLTKPGFESRIKDETLRDTLMDMINYSTYAVSLLDGTWGKRPGYADAMQTVGKMSQPAQRGEAIADPSNSSESPQGGQE